MRNVTKELDRLSYVLPLGVLSSLGNHELYNFSKHRWAREVWFRRVCVVRIEARLRADPSPAAMELPSVALSPRDANVFTGIRWSLRSSLSHVGRREIFARPNEYTP